MASNSSVYIECSDWLVFGRDFTVRTITMETVLFWIFFFSCYRSGKIQTVKTQEDKNEKVWSRYKTNERGKHVCLEKVLFN